MPTHLCSSFGEFMFLTHLQTSPVPVLQWWAMCHTRSRSVQLFCITEPAPQTCLVCRKERNTFIVMSSVMHSPFPNNLTVLVLILIFEGQAPSVTIKTNKETQPQLFTLLCLFPYQCMHLSKIYELFSQPTGTTRSHQINSDTSSK